MGDDWDDAALNGQVRLLTAHPVCSRPAVGKLSASRATLGRATAGRAVRRRVTAGAPSVAPLATTAVACASHRARGGQPPNGDSTQLPLKARAMPQPMPANTNAKKAKPKA